MKRKDKPRGRRGNEVKVEQGVEVVLVDSIIPYVI
jgi:hypothetical protein